MTQKKKGKKSKLQVNKQRVRTLTHEQAEQAQGGSGEGCKPPDCSFRAGTKAAVY